MADDPAVSTLPPLAAQRVSPSSEPYTVAEERRRPPEGRRATDLRTNARQGVTGARIVELPRITDPRGNLTPIEGGRQVPFSIARVYYLYDIPGGEARGGHAHRECVELLIAAAGSLDVLVDDGVDRERFFLNRSYYGLLVPSMLWRELDNFSSGSVCLVLASTAYDEGDYLRDYDEFRAQATGS